MQPIFPPHNDYPSHPDEPRLLIPPRDHCNGKMAPVIWDPFRANHQVPHPVSASSSPVRSPLTLPDRWMQGDEPSAAARQLMMYFECACCIHQPVPKAKCVSYTPEDFSVGSDLMHEVHEETFCGDPHEGSAFQVYEQRVSHTPDDFFVRSDFMHEDNEESVYADPREGSAFQVYERQYKP